MRALHLVGVALFGLSLLACQVDTDEPIDPGPPGEESGPKCTVEFQSAPIDKLEQCTAIARVTAGGAQLFLQLYPDREPTQQRRYVSLVLPNRSWQPGDFNHAVAGRMDMMFNNGRHYRLEPNSSGWFPIDLHVDEVNAGEADGYQELRGDLEATLPGVSGTTGSIGFKVTIDQ